MLYYVTWNPHFRSHDFLPFSLNIWVSVTETFDINSFGINLRKRILWNSEFEFDLSATLSVSGSFLRFCSQIDFQRESVLEIPPLSSLIQRINVQLTSKWNAILCRKACKNVKCFVGIYFFCLCDCIWWLGIVWPMKRITEYLLLRASQSDYQTKAKLKLCIMDSSIVFHKFTFELREFLVPILDHLGPRQWILFFDECS